MPENSTPKYQRKPRLDPRNPYVVDLRDGDAYSGRSPGTMRELRRSVPVNTALALDLVAVPEGASLEVDVRLESVTEGVLATGTVTAPIVGECGRCLDPVNDELVVEFVELFVFEGSATDETTEQDEVHRVEDDLIDLEPVVRDAVVLGLPFAPLCRPDCGGLCPECGQKLDELPADHTHEKIDPRWAKLANLAETRPDENVN
jgi:uncharacterized protein